jgi:hypothetical protein
VVRGVIAAALCLALQVGALWGALLHAHLDDHDTGHHAGHRIHAHFSGHIERHHAPAGSSLVAADSAHVTRLDVFVAVHAAPVTAPALPPARFALPAIADSVMRQSPELVRSHGPPSVRSAAPRAPPALLVLI